jgi:hypothetical protein
VTVTVTLLPTVVIENVFVSAPLCVTLKVPVSPVWLRVAEWPVVGAPDCENVRELPLPATVMLMDPPSEAMLIEAVLLSPVRSDTRVLLLLETVTVVELSSPVTQAVTLFPPQAPGALHVRDVVLLLPTCFRSTVLLSPTTTADIELLSPDWYSVTVLSSP